MRRCHEIVGSSTGYRVRISFGIGCALLLQAAPDSMAIHRPNNLDPPEMTETLAEVTSRAAELAPGSVVGNSLAIRELNGLIETALRTIPA